LKKLPKSRAIFANFVSGKIIENWILIVPIFPCPLNQTTCSRSLAQVHKAQRSMALGVLKIQRPKHSEVIAPDISIMKEGGHGFRKI